MRLVVSDGARALIVERGGRLYVSIRKDSCARCASTLRMPVAVSNPTGDHEWRRVADDEDFELFMPRGISQLPEELRLEMRRLPRRIEAYWNGCPWID